MTSGVVFNIQRFSIHDGPGIRTTVFFKGCSLFCFWCHNPEGRSAKPDIQFIAGRCIVCGECGKVCLHDGHDFSDGAHTYHRERCQACGRCVDGCFAGALQMAGKEMTVDEVMRDVVSDRSFYQTSGGGVTLSGGEPLLQRDFAQAILERCRAEDIHTAIETCANCRWQDLASLLPYTNLVMMDLKHIDPTKHRAVTGVSNERILANAERLMETSVPVLFRTPVIPTVNATADEIAAIARFVRHLGERRAAWNLQTEAGAPLPSLELLPFHKLAGDKFRSLGCDDPAAGLTPLSREQMQALAAVARQEGIDVKLR